MADRKIPRRTRLIDLTGRRFGRLVVLGLAAIRSKQGGCLWDCLCDCGARWATQGESLRGGLTKSCGCYSRDLTKARNTTHGYSRTREYGIYKGMLGRCLNPNDRAYANYGGRGLTVCRRWRRSFLAFLKDVGPRPTPQHTLDRINNNLLRNSYSKKNVRWTTVDIQARNTRRNVHLTYQGRTKTQSEWAREFGLSIPTLSNRIRKGWPVERALTAVPKTWGPHRDECRSVHRELDYRARASPDR